MRIFSNVTMSSNVSMASNAKDQFTIGSELERDNANADEFKVWANANFYNDVTLGSSSVDIVEVKGQLTASQGIKINDLKIQTSEDFLRSSNGTAATGSFLTSSTYDAEIFIGTNEGTNTVSLYAQSLRMQGELEAYINAPTIALNGPLTASSGIDTQFISASGISTFETAQFNNVVITAGNIDGTVIGDNYQNTGHFTTLTASGISINGDIIPTQSASYSLGSPTKPFKEIYVGSGSISIASPLSGVVATTISNNSGNLDISAGGVKLIGTGSFIGNGSQLTDVLASNLKQSYVFLTSSGQSASFDQSIVYLNDGNNAHYGLPDIDGKDGHLITMKNLKNSNATIYAYTGQTINGNATHTIPGNSTEMFHAVSSSNIWYTILSTLALPLLDIWELFGYI